MTAPNRRPSVEGALGNHEKRISTLESIAPPTAAAATQRPIFGFTAVQAQRTTPTKWPGAMRVVPCYGFVNSGSTVNHTGFAYRQIADAQVAANYAAAGATLFATVDDFLLDSTIRYQCWIGVKVAANPGTANVGISSTGIGTNEINLTGTPSDNFALYRLFADKTFVAGEDIEVKVYRTASTGDIEIDQLYFFPSGVASYNTGPSGVMDAVKQELAIAAGADIGISASTVADARFNSVNAVKDTQVADDYKAADPSAWSFSGMQPLLYSVELATNAEYDDELRWFRHNYVTACYDSTADTTFVEGCMITLAGDGVPTATARVYQPSVGIYYIGPGTTMGAPPQLTLWRHTTPAGGGDAIPYASSEDPSATTNDVRVGEYFAISSYLDDYY